MIRVSASYSRKAPGVEQFSSEGFNAGIDVELPDLLAADQEALKAKLHEMFGELKQAVDQEVDAARKGSNGRHEDRRPREDNRPANGNGDRLATRAQVRAVHALARRLGEGVVDLVRKRYGVDNADALNIRQASTLIDEMKATAAEGRPQERQP